MAELEAEKSMLSAQVREQERELRAIQSACSNLNNNGYRLSSFSMMDSCTLSSYPVDWTEQQKKEASERKELGNQVHPTLTYTMNCEMDPNATMCALDRLGYRSTV